jgi:L-ascorbate metabolism protein UlaG (beta-lactamase superfamily)
MVEIVSLGLSSFKIIGKEIAVVCDPYVDSAVGLKFPKVEANVVTVSHEHADHNNRDGVRGESICFDAPGEYEIKGAKITGIKSYHDDKQGTERGSNTIFVYEIDDLTLCHLGDLGHALNAEQIERIDGVDVLFVPVGGHVTIDAKAAARVIAEINPKIVIPIHYSIGNRSDLDSVEGFLKEMGKEPKTVSDIKIKAKDLGENVEIYVMNPKTK